MPVQNNRKEILLERKLSEIRKRAEKGEATTKEVRLLPEDEQKKYLKIINNKQQLKSYYKKKDEKIKSGVLKKKRGRYSKYYDCDMCGQEFTRKYVSKSHNPRFCSNECRYKNSEMLMKIAHSEYLNSLPPKDDVIYRYKIILVKDGVHVARVHGVNLQHRQWFVEKEDAFNVFEIILEERRGVVLPKRFDGNKNEKRQYELLLLRLNDDDSDHTKYPNEYGKLIENIVEVSGDDNPLNWIIVNKKDFNIEETFGIFGYDLRYDQKDIHFIIDNFLFNDMDYKKITVYRNKLLILKNDVVEEVIVGKRKVVTMDLYNKLKSICGERKIKHISFAGFADGPLTKRHTEELIMKKTGWSRAKIVG